MIDDHWGFSCADHCRAHVVSQPDADVPAVADIDAYILSEPSILEIHDDVVRWRITSARLTQGYLDRIARFDREGPRINAIITVHPRAVRIAAELDRARTANAGPLYGIPLLVKDNINTVDTATTAGSAALENTVPTYDAHVVSLLRDAGAVIIGKANLHEFGLGISTISSLSGETLNPHDLTRNCAGSRGGPPQAWLPISQCSRWAQTPAALCGFGPPPPARSVFGSRRA